MGQAGLPYQLIERIGAPLPLLLDKPGAAQLAGQLTHCEGDHEEHGEQQQVFDAGDVKREVWRDEEEIPKQRADRSGKNNG